MRNLVRCMDFRDEEEESILKVYMGGVTLEEADRAIRSLKGYKMPGFDEISANFSRQEVVQGSQL